MRQIHLADEIYEQAQRRASDAGFASVDAYVADMVLHDSASDSNSEHLFTPEIVAELDRTASSIQAGARTYSDDEVAAHFEERRKAWPINRRA